MENKPRPTAIGERREAMHATAWDWDTLPIL